MPRADTGIYPLLLQELACHPPSFVQLHACRTPSAIASQTQQLTGSMDPDRVATVLVGEELYYLPQDPGLGPPNSNATFMLPAVLVLVVSAC